MLPMYTGGAKRQVEVFRGFQLQRTNFKVVHVVYKDTYFSKVVNTKPHTNSHTPTQEPIGLNSIKEIAKY